MTQPAQFDRETSIKARQLAEFHRVAQERLGLSTAFLAYWTFNQLNFRNADAVRQAELAMLETTQALRQVSRRLARRYFNLSRAIQTGYLYPDPDFERGPGSSVHLEQLLAELEDVLTEVLEVTSRNLSEVTPESLPEEGAAEEEPKNRTTDEAEELVDVLQEQLADLREDFDWDVAAEVEDGDWSDEEDDDILDADLREELDKTRKEISDLLESELEAKRATKKADDRQDAGSARMAGKLDKGVVDAGRELVWNTGRKDRRRKAWIRVTGPDPCAFCSMLASRGADYSSEKTALYSSEGDKYHPNCHCTAHAVYVDDPAYDVREKYFMDAWKNEIADKGYDRDEALRVWRRWLTAQKRKGLVPDHTEYTPAP